MDLPTTAAAVAQAQFDLKQWVEATSTVSRLLAMPSAASDPPAFERAREQGRQMMVEIRSRMPTVRFRVEPGSDVVVSMDGTILRPDQLAESTPANPGHHVIRYSSPAKTLDEEVELSESEARELVVPRIAPAIELPATPAALPIEPAPPAPASAAPVSSTTTVSVSEPPRFKRVLFTTGVLTGGVGIALGAATGIASIVETHQIESNCQNQRCPADSASGMTKARTLATISDVAFVVGGLGAAATVTSFFVRSSPHPAVGTSVQPWVSVGGAGLRGSF